MIKVMLAVGYRELEEFIQKKVKNEFIFVGVTTYREGVIRSIGQNNPDVVVIRETLEGKENILSIVYEIRNKFPRVRVIYLAGKREPGDQLLATLVSYGVYDILYGDKIQAQDVIALLRNANEYKDVQHLQPRPVFDEKKNKVLYEAPEIVTIEKEVVKEVVKEIYIDGAKNDNPSKDEVTEPVTPKPPLKLEKESEKVIEKVTPEPQPREVIDEPVVKPPEKSLEEVVEKAEPKPVEKPDKKPVEKKPPVEVRKPKEVEDEPKSGGGIFKWFGGGKAEKQIDSVNGKQKILTFMGAKSGLGNSSIALNTAVQLASKKNKVIYMEMNDSTPSVNYWYELGHLEDGIDTALVGIEANNFEKVKKAIVHSSDLLKKESALQKNYKKFPHTLDFIFFSNRYLTRNHLDDYRFNLTLTKELYLYLLFQLEYDYIVLDVPSDLDNIATLNALLYSNKTFLTITQDVSAIGNSVYLLNELSKRGIEVAKKTQFIVNRYEKAELDLNEITEWIQVNDLLTVPSCNKDFIDANFVGLPIVIHSKNSHIKSAFQKIEKKIL